MALGDLILPATIGGIACAAAAAFSWVVYSRFFVRSPPNRAVVLYGGQGPISRNPLRPQSETAEVHPPRIVVGGTVFVAPWNRSVGYLSLVPVEVDLTIRSLHSLAANAASGWEAQIGVQAKIPSDPSFLATATENLLGKDEEGIRTVVRRAVEGAGPAILARHGPSDPEPDWEALAAEIQAAVAAELVAVGLIVQNLSVKQLVRLTRGAGAAALTASRPEMPRSTTADPEGEAPPSTGIDLRLARLERSVGVLGAQIDRVVQDGALPRGRLAAGVRVDPVPSTTGEVSVPGSRPGRGSVHDSMGGDSPPRPHPTSRSGPSSEEKGDSRSLLDTEAEG
ncbi:MAG: SPFH domain-containing protein [Thermoplasmata archaeon]|nr:SPFH domain-containing protein [Thermoplasmata archaeon]